MNIEVDNEILASVIDARFGIKPQLSSNIEKANFKQTICSDHLIQQLHFYFQMASGTALQSKET